MLQTITDETLDIISIKKDLMFLRDRLRNQDAGFTHELTVWMNKIDAATDALRSKLTVVSLQTLQKKKPQRHYYLCAFTHVHVCLLLCFGPYPQGPSDSARHGLKPLIFWFVCSKFETNSADKRECSYSPHHC
jgi:hypothetical protein